MITDIAAGETERGAQLAGLAKHLREDVDEPRDPSGARLYDPALEEAERVLGIEVFSRALARGAKLSLEDALALAVSPGAAPSS